MKKLLTTDSKTRFQFITRVVTITVLLFAVCMTSYYAWFYLWRRAAAAAKVSDPTSIFINAGNREDIRYLNLADLDLETGDTYKDYVFCVRGSVQFYKLQLAYTTNNQFNYEIYPAAELTSGDLPNNTTASVTWTVHTGDDEGTQKTYYSTSSYIPGTILNKETNAANMDLTDEILAKAYDDPNRTYYSNTYGNYSDHHKYAVPLYWQSDSSIHVEDTDAEGNFCHYFILRIKWDNPTANRTNNKETDIIYISAKNITSNNG